MANKNQNFNLVYKSLSNTPTLLKSGLTELWGWNLINTNAAQIAYIQLFDTSDIANIILGTTSPTRTIVIPAGAGSFNFQAFNFDGRKTFASGLVIAATTTRTGSSALGSAIDTEWDIN